MKYQQIIAELEELTRQLSLVLRYEKGDFEGGYCILKERRVLVVNKKLTEVRRASVLAQALAEMGVEDVFLKPVLRQFIEDEAAKVARKK